MELCKCQPSESSEFPRLCPFIPDRRELRHWPLSVRDGSPSTRTMLPLRWDPDSTHASPASRCGAIGAPREEVLLDQQKTSNHGFLWGPRKTEFLS